MDMDILSDAITFLACSDGSSVSIKLFESLDKHGFDNSILFTVYEL